MQGRLMAYLSLCRGTRCYTIERKKFNEFNYSRPQGAVNVSFNVNGFQ